MLTLREFSAWIMSGGEPLPEYLVTVDHNANKISCWIPCEAGKSFSVHWRDAGTQKYSCAYISLDGFQVPGRFLGGYGEASREGIRTSPNTERPFVFTGQSSTSTGGRRSPDAGTIVLKIRIVDIDGARPANKIQKLPDFSGSQNRTSHIGYGQERPAFEQYSQTWNVKDDESGNRSYVTFVFRYRSRDFLVSQGIVHDALRIPPAVRQACASTCRIASDPQQAGDPPLTPSPMSSQTGNNRRHMSSGLQNAFNPGSVPVRAATSSRSASTSATRLPSRFPGEGVIDFSAGLDSKDTFRLEKRETKDQQR